MGEAGGLKNRTPLEGLGMRILVAETDTQLLAEMQQVLEQAGHEVIVTNDGMGAWGYVAGHSPPDLLITRLQLVRSSPPGTALGLRAQARSPRIPVIYIPSNPERAKLAEAGHGAILIKPFALEELLAAVNRLLGIRPVTGNDAEPAGGPCAQS
jgi:DNA-binding response OmpR family regulator